MRRGRRDIGASGRSAISLAAALLVLAACSPAAAPVQIADPLASASATASLTPVEPDFDVTKNGFYADCMSAERDMKVCTCMTSALKAGVDAETYRAFFANGMSAVIHLPKPQAEVLYTTLRKAARDCGAKA